MARPSSRQQTSWYIPSFPVLTLPPKSSVDMPEILHSLPPPQVGSPTALSEATVEQTLVRQTREGTHGLYVPAGAFWGGQDIQKMADRGTLKVRNCFMCGTTPHINFQSAYHLGHCLHKFGVPNNFFVYFHRLIITMLWNNKIGNSLPFFFPYYALKLLPLPPSCLS